MSSTPPSTGKGSRVPGTARHTLIPGGSRQAIDLEVPLDPTLTTVVRLAVAALADEAGIGQEQAEVAREEIGTVFVDLCDDKAERETARLHVEVGEGALLVVARTSGKEDPVTVRWWGSIPDPI